MSYNNYIKEDLEETQHIFNQKKVYYNDGEGSRNQGYVYKNCINCSSEFFQPVSSIINGRKAICSKNCRDAIRSGWENSSSKYKGVSYNQDQQKWSSVITKNGERYYLGMYESEKQAAKAYDDKCKELYENPRLNLSD